MALIMKVLESVTHPTAECFRERTRLQNFRM